MKRLFILSCVALLAACGGGGGGGSGGGFLPVAVAPAPAPAPAPEVAPMKALTPVNTNCVQVAPNHINCDLIAGAFGPGVPAGQFVSFTNRTGTYMQVDQVDAYTAERSYWSEYCAYLGGIEQLTTKQETAGKGEVGCATKQIGEDYAPMRWGNDTGLSVAPGEMFMLNTHTEPAQVNHTFTVRASVQASGLHSWRAPRVDEVIPCNDQMQLTVMDPWQNTTGGNLHLTGASIYSETASSAERNTLSGAACIYVLTAEGAVKYQNCDAGLRTRGEVAFPLVTISPGDYVGAQAGNACRSGNHWDWVAFLRVW